MVSPNTTWPSDTTIRTEARAPFEVPRGDELAAVEGAGADDDVLGPIVRDIWPDADGRMWFVEWSRNKVASAELRRP